MAILEHVDRLGSGSMLDGTLRGIEEGYFQLALSESAYQFERALDSGERAIVGVNKYAKEEEDELEILRIGAEVEHFQNLRLKELRSARDDQAVESALVALETGARGDANLMPLLVDACRVRATQGEIVERLKRVFGTYREQARI
jgi:methylmalonyl-CoA mutase N-terminal domain/subunit